MDVMDLANPVSGAQFVDPAVLARIGNLELVARSRSSTASSTACTARRSSARRSTSPSTAATCRATTSAASTGGVRAHRQVLRQGVRGRLERQLHRSCSTCRSRWRSARGITQARLRQDAGRVPHLPGAQAARSRRPGHLRRRRRRPRAAVGQAPRRRAAHARSRQGRRGPAQLGRAAAQAGRALRPPRHRRRDLGLLRRARGDLRGGRPDPLPRQRRHPVPRARPGGARLPVHRRRRASRTSRAASSCRSCPTRSASSTGRWSRSTSRADARRRPSSGVDYTLLNTSMPLDFALFDYLSIRDRLRRTR